MRDASTLVGTLATVAIPYGVQPLSSPLPVTVTVMRSRSFRYALPTEFDLMAELARMRLREQWGRVDAGAVTSESRKHVSGADEAGNVGSTGDVDG